MKELMLYIHIPFCERKCDYCDFLSAESTQLEREDYVETLCKEIMLHKDLGQKVTITSIFFGGGTPSILTTVQITKIMNTIQVVFPHVDKNPEITLEINPGTADRNKLNTYKKIGINRLSIGLQAVNNNELKSLGRIHTYEVFLSTYQKAREVGFDNINIDLMSAIPGQTLPSWIDTLDKVISLNPEHISAYSLIIEEDTPYYDIYSEEAKGLHLLPSEEEERSMYYETQSRLKKAGYERYEISNYSKKEKECKHNCGYWERTPYLGMGLGASSLLDEVRYMNHSDILQYLDAVKDNIKPIAQKETVKSITQQEEYIYLGLRKIKGISLTKYKESFGNPLEDVYNDVLSELYKNNLIEKKGEYLKLTDKGIDLSNYVLSRFIIE